MAVLKTVILSQRIHHGGKEQQVLIACFPAPDGFSYGGSFGELRSTCMEEFPPAFDFGSYLDMLSQVNVTYPDSPPR